MNEEQECTSVNVPSLAAASFSPDAKILLTASREGFLTEWDPSTGRRVRVLLDPTATEDAQAPSLVRLEENGSEVAASFRIARLSECMRGSSLLSVCFSPDGKRFAAGAANGAVVVWNTQSRCELLYWFAHEAEVIALDISPDRQWLATGSLEEGGDTLRVWRLSGVWPARGREVFADGRLVGGVWAVCFSPDSRFVAAGGWTYSGYTAPQIFNLETKERVKALLFETTRAMQYSPDGEHIATGDEYGAVSIWNVEKSKRIHEMEAHGDIVNVVHFSRDGLRLASGSIDGGLKIWDVSTGDQLAAYSFKGKVLACRFSEDSRVLYVAEAATGTDLPTIHALDQSEMS